MCDNGQPIGFWEAFGRNLFRLVDVWMGGIGLLPMLLSRREKRFGDWLSSTVVINNQALKKPLSIEHWDGVTSAFLPENESIKAQVLSASERLSAEELDLLGQYLSRKKKLYRASVRQLEDDFRTYFKKRLQLSDEVLDERHLLEALYRLRLDALKI